MTLIAGFHDGRVIRISDPPKAASASEIKLAPADGTTLTDKGLVVARIATLNTVDLQGDVTVTGAVGSGQDVLIGQWNHGSFEKGLLPAGKGRVREEGDYLVLRGQFFMDTIVGRETFLTLKAMVNSPWSYGYNIAEADRGSFKGEFVRFLRKLVINEASPVMQAAGVGTGTVQLSSLDPMQLMVASAAHHNERELQRLGGFIRKARERVGTFDGAPVFVGAGGRK